MLLRAAVGLDRLDWPERRMTVQLETRSPHVGFLAVVQNWPPWAVVIDSDVPECEGDGSGFDFAADRWAVTCATDPGLRTGPSELATVRYKGPAVDPASLALTSELVDANLVTTPATLRLVAR
jgi:hypothetical protein